MGIILHETRHVVQHSRGIINAVTQSSSLNAVDGAYRAQYFWGGSLHLNSLDRTTIPDIENFQTDPLNRKFFNTRDMPLNVKSESLNNINLINRGLINNIVEIRKTIGTLLIPNV